MNKKLLKILQKDFKLESFREGQEEVIASVCKGEDTMVFMPTGGGKSLTYQLPGLFFDGVCLVISPLISLMKDQVDKLNELGIRAELINSTIDSFERDMILNELSKPNTEIKFLYIAPERLNSNAFLRVVSMVNISLVAIDEAHCISAWGHDFRPSYMKIKGFLNNLKDTTNNSIKKKSFPIMALTATATEKVREDIVKRLDLGNYNSFTAGFDRKNITIIVRELSKKDDKINKVVEILNKTKGVGIIYCSSRKAVKEVYDTLTLNNVKAGIYTGAMTPVNREKEQNSFMNDDYKVIVATNAFGMGIDKKDIRFVIHYNLPGSIENYYQEVGRAGRDGKQSFGIILASFADTKIQEFFIENTYPSKNEILQLYDYFFKGIPEGGGKNIAILKTYATIAKESKIDSDMKVGSALKILEKYGILRRGVSDSMNDGEFRGRGIILIQEKRKHSNLLIDWNHQMLLKDEAYYKLDQIKKLLFYPSCRKRFILKYFGDKEDLDVLPKNCARCDFCIEKKNLDKIEIKDYVNTSVFALVLDVVKNNDSKIGVVMMTKFLRGSIDAKIKQWRLDEKENYGALSDLNSDLIQAVIESLISLDYLYKSDGKYPLLGITDAGKIAIIRNEFLVDDNKELQQFIRLKLGDKLDKESQKLKKPKKEKNATYNETLKLFKKGISLKDISQQRELGLQTIEGHIVKLYSLGNILLTDILNFTTFGNLNIIKDTINNDLNGDIGVLKTIKDTIKQKNISYFEIKIAIAMIQKKDL